MTCFIWHPSVWYTWKNLLWFYVMTCQWLISANVVLLCCISDLQCMMCVKKTCYHIVYMTCQCIIVYMTCQCTIPCMFIRLRVVTFYQTCFLCPCVMSAKSSLWYSLNTILLLIIITSWILMNSIMYHVYQYNTSCTCISFCKKLLPCQIAYVLQICYIAKKSTNYFTSLFHFHYEYIIIIITL